MTARRAEIIRRLKHAQYFGYTIKLSLEYSCDFGRVEGVSSEKVWLYGDNNYGLSIVKNVEPSYTDDIGDRSRIFCRNCGTPFRQ